MNSVSFQTQLASIMEVLANAAVAEICELVDDGYAVLHLEISRRQKENEALKRKLQLMELRISQRCVDKPRVRILDEIGASEDAELTSEDIADNQLDLSAWREEESTSMDAEKTPIKPDECAEKEKGRPESVLIKKEKLEEDMVSSDPQGGLNISAERGREADGVEKVAIVVTHTVLATGTEDVAEKQRTKNGVWEDSGLDAVLKTEPENDNVTLQDTGSEHIVEKNNLGNEHVMYERAGQLDTFYTRGFAEKEAESAACSYAPATDSVSFSGHSDLQPSAGSNEMLPGWSKEPMSGMVQTQQRRYKEDRRRERLQLGNVLFPPRTHLPNQESVASKSGSPDVNGWAPCDDHFAKSKSAKVPYRVGARRKLFICTFCGKSLACLKNLKTHLRVHTGEKPFSCAQCGKRFADSSNLKRHQSVHTGERKYGCTHCGKRFAQSGSLKVHQSVHTGQRQYSCVQCGKTFISSSHLKRHVSVHTEEHF
ncbi:hypothetical protein JZ751_000713 [Albula glossodonta]|uniref:C2H2-type domain-containing protein n=1 Tax=Albula glossodonta TaxID=121402 RepID=A0A8T2PWY3_9TELE|nr:hypothetical protein JZ751_000713 [Albula glossodonta]